MTKDDTTGNQKNDITVYNNEMDQEILSHQIFLSSQPHQERGSHKEHPTNDDGESDDDIHTEFLMVEFRDAHNKAIDLNEKECDMEILGLDSSNPVCFDKNTGLIHFGHYEEIVGTNLCFVHSNPDDTDFTCLGSSCKKLIFQMSDPAPKGDVRRDFYRRFRPGEA